jgi:hypothetical protein
VNFQLFKNVFDLRGGGLSHGGRKFIYATSQMPLSASFPLVALAYLAPCALFSFVSSVEWVFTITPMLSLKPQFAPKVRLPVPGRGVMHRVTGDRILRYKTRFNTRFPNSNCVTLIINRPNISYPLFESYTTVTSILAYNPTSKTAFILTKTVANCSIICSVRVTSNFYCHISITPRL